MSLFALNGSAGSMDIKQKGLVYDNVILNSNLVKMNLGDGNKEYFVNYNENMGFISTFFPEINVNSIKNKKELESNILKLLNTKELGIDLKQIKQYGSNCQTNKNNCYFTYTQNYQGIPVWNGYINVGINNEYINWYKSAFYPNIKISIKPQLNVNKIKKIVQKDLQQKPSILSNQLIIFPKESTGEIKYHLTYKVELDLVKTNSKIIQKYNLEENLPLAPTYFIDANTGDILDVTNKYIGESYYGTVTGEIYPEHSQQQTEIVPFKNEQISFNEEDNQVNINTNSNGEFVFDSSENPIIINTTLYGPYVTVLNGLYINETVIATDPTSTYYDLISPGENSFSWSVEDLSYKHEQSNVFYHVNKIHDYFTTENEFSFPQMDYPMYARVNGGNDRFTCNAYSLCAIDLDIDIGTIDRSRIGFTGADEECESAALSSDTIYHEYTHSVVCNTYPFGMDYYDEPGGMNEGWADYFAATISGNPCHHEYFYWDTSSGICLRELNEDYYYSNIHNNHDRYYFMKFFSSSLWSFRERVGAEIADNIVAKSMTLLPNTFSEAIDAMLTIDDNNGNLEDGTPHITQICDSFLEHGLFSNSCNGFLTEHLVKIESPSTDDHILGNRNIIINGTIISSLDHKFDSFRVELISDSNDLVNYDVEYLSNRDSVLNLPLANLRFSNSVMGTYTIRLIVTDEMGNEFEDSIDVQIYVNGIATDGSVQTSDLIIGDFNNDGSNEIGANIYKSRNERFNIYNSNGELLYSFYDDSSYKKEYERLATGNIDDDEFKEIVALRWPYESYWVPSSTLSLYIYDISSEQNNEGIYYPQNIPLTEGTEFIDSLDCSVVLANFDEDEPLEIAAVTKNSMWLLNGDGSYLSGWPKSLDLPSDSEIVSCSLATNDFNQDGTDEIVLAISFVDQGSVKTKVNLWQKDQSWSNNELELPFKFGTMAISDINGDSLNEIIISTDSLGDRKVNVLNNELELIDENLFDNLQGSFTLSKLDDTNDIKLIDEKNIYSFNQQQPITLNYHSPWFVPGESRSLIGTFNDETSIFKLVTDGTHPKIFMFNGNGELNKIFDLPRFLSYKSVNLNDLTNNKKTDLILSYNKGIIYFPLDSRSNGIKVNRESYNNRNTLSYSPLVNFLPIHDYEVDRGYCNDNDFDCIKITYDNCPNSYNPNQKDSDNDGLGDVCDPCVGKDNDDPDGDRICGKQDNCPNINNPEQEDSDNDGEGDACDKRTYVFNRNKDEVMIKRTSDKITYAFNKNKDEVMIKRARNKIINK